MKQITVRKKCDKCVDGELIYNKCLVTLEYNTHYSHMCNKCKNYIQLEEVYPKTYIEFEENEKLTKWE